MPARDVRIWTLERADVPEAADVLARAFQDSPFFAACIPDPDIRRAHLPPLFAACLHYGCRYGRGVVARQDAGQIVGAGWWYRFPDAHFTHERTQAVGFDAVDELLGEGSDRIVEISRGIDAAMTASFPEPRANLDQIGVDPACQGRGIGAALLRRIVADAAAERLPVALWTDSEANVEFYLHCGFELAIDGSARGDAIPWWGLCHRKD